MVSSPCKKNKKIYQLKFNKQLLKVDNVLKINIRTQERKLVILNLNKNFHKDSKMHIIKLKKTQEKLTKKLEKVQILRMKKLKKGQILRMKKPKKGQVKLMKKAKSLGRRLMKKEKNIETSLKYRKLKERLLKLWRVGSKNLKNNEINF